VIGLAARALELAEQLIARLDRLIELLEGMDRRDGRAR
jgi:hypothetical protein